MLRFRLFRIPILVHPSLWVTLALFGAIWGVQCESVFLSMLYFIFAGFICLLTHELAHALVGRAWGGGTPKILLSGLGGECCNPQARLSRRQGLLMTLMGTLMTLLVAFASLGLLYVTSDYDNDLLTASFFTHLKGDCSISSACTLPVGVVGLLHSLIMVSVWWTLLNFIPVYPLDGGQILCGLVDANQMGFAHALSIFASVIFFFFFLMLGLWLLCVFMLVLLYINFRWWRVYAQ